MKKYRTVIMDEDPDRQAFILKFIIPYSAISANTYKKAKCWVLSKGTRDVDELLSVVMDVLRDEILYRTTPDYELDEEPLDR